jgi:hypothetical protein
LYPPSHPLIILFFSVSFSTDLKGDVPLSELMRYAQPYLRNIMIFRDPVSRHFSAFHYYNSQLAREGKLTAEYYDQRVREEVARWKMCLDQVRGQVVVGGAFL